MKGWPGGVTWGIAGLAALGWVPFLFWPASPDEGGFLLVASRWGPGSSLYGNYWVDRPPLLLLIHEAAAGLGGTLALRLMGMAGVVISVLLSAAVVRLVRSPSVAGADRFAATTPVLIAGVFLTTPLFGTTHVDGELLCCPFVLGGIYSYLRAAHEPRGSALRWALSAGVLATAAAMVKQNVVDVFVFAAVAAFMEMRAGEGRRTARIVVVFGVGAATAGAALLGIAWLRGTEPAGLWDALVVFRWEAAAAIAGRDTGLASPRLGELMEAAALSFAPLVIGVLAWRVRRTAVLVTEGVRGPLDLRGPAAALLVWEVVSVAGGGTFWLHYLLLLVPGMVLLGVAAAQRPPSATRSVKVVMSLVALSAVVSISVAVAKGTEHAADQRVADYLRSHSASGDTAVVAFGHADILWDARMHSPYSLLWSLPVRVRDSHLADFTAVLKSSRAPTWVVVTGTSLSTWGVEAAPAQEVLRTDYHLVRHRGPYTLWRRDAPAGPRPVG